MNKAARLVQAVQLLGTRPALIIIARHEAAEIAQQAHAANYYEPFMALHGQTVEGVPIAVADIAETVTMAHDMTLARVLL